MDVEIDADDGYTLEVERDDPLIGEEIGNRYKLEEVLGAGGMGVVYGATQVEIERPVAVKVLKIHDADGMERFRREAVTIGKLGHPNIIDIYDVGRLADGRPYMVMPRVSGPDLGVLIDEGERFGAPEVVALLEGPASALTAMHEQGFVHRDIKPDNLMMDELGDGTRRVLLLDFGLATLVKSNAKRLTREGLVSGTPQYISPEAARAKEPGPSSDVYSLAAVAFELMAGVCPFDGENSLEIMMRKVQEDAPTLRSMGVDVSLAVEDVIATGLARDPENRYSSPRELIDELRRATEMGVSSEAADPPARSHTTSGALEIPGTARPPWMFVALGAALLIGLGAVLFVAWPDADAPDEPAVASADADVDPIDDSTNTASPEPVVAAADTVEEPQPTVVEETVASAVEPAVSTRSSRRRRTAPSVAPVVAPSAPTPVAAAPTPPAPVAAEPASPQQIESNRELARERSAEGTRALVSGRLPRAIERFRGGTLAAPDYAPAWRGLGLANERMGHGAEARRAYRRYLALAPSAPDAATIRRRLDELEP